MARPQFPDPRAPYPAKHGDRSTCAWCGQEIYLFSDHPQRSDGTWLHVRDYPDGFAEQFGQNSAYCVELRATPIDYPATRGLL